jgi:HEAT repeat protein
MPLFGPPDLFKLGARNDVPGLVKALGYEKDPRVPPAAARVLGQVGDPAAVEPLIAIVRDGGRGSPLRRAAATALGQLRDPRAVEPLVAALSDNDQEIRVTAVEALGELGAPAVPHLLDALKVRDSHVSAAAARALNRLGWQPDRDELGAWYWAARGDDERCVEIGAPAVRPLLAHAAQFGDASLKPAAALRRIGVPAVEPLVATLAGQDHSVRRAAVCALGAICGTRAPEPRATASGDGGRSMREDAFFRLAPFRDAATVEGLLAAVGSGDSEVSALAAEIIGRLGDARAVEPLIVVLENREQGDPACSQAAAEALGRIGDARAVEPLAAALADDKARDNTRGAAAEALGRIGDARAVGPLVAALEADVWLVRRAAANALVALYRSDGLGSADRARVLARRGDMIQAHRDFTPSCAPHVDTGVGAAFTVTPKPT